MNEGSIPAELHYTLSSASPNEGLRRVRAAFESAGTETVDILGLLQEGAKLYYAGSCSLAEARRLKVAVGGVIAIAYEQPPERLHLRRLSADYGNTNIATPAAGEAPGVSLVSSDSIEANPPAKESVNAQPFKDAEFAASEARRQWKSRFRARVRMMEKLLASAPDDNVPTPRGDGDD